MFKAVDVMNKDFVKIDKNDSLSLVIGKLKKANQRIAVVFDKNKYIGIVARKLLYRSKIDPIKTKIGKFVIKPHSITPQTDMLTGAELMYASYPSILPVMKGKNLIGIVSAENFLYKIKEIKELRNLKAKEIMTHKPFSINYKDRLGKALNIMKENHFSRLPITNKEGNVISLLSLTDIAEQHLLKPIEKFQGTGKSRYQRTKGGGDKKFILDAPAGDAASRIVITSSSKDSLAKVIDQMYKYKISDVIIVKNRKPEGIITTRDLLETFLRLKKPEFWGVYYYGLYHLKSMQKKGLTELVTETYEKVRRAYIKDTIYFLVHIKPYEEGERSRTKWSIRLRLATPARVLTTWEISYDLNTAISGALKKMEMRIQEFRVKTREKRQKYKKGRRVMYEHLIRREAAESSTGVPAFGKLIKR